MPKVVRFSKLGGPEVLQIEDVMMRELAEGEVLIKVAVVGLNRAESMFFHGQYMEMPEFPAGLGYEAVGTVTEVGPGVDRALVGKTFGTVPAFSMNRYTVLGEQAIVPANALVALPTSLSPTEGAAAWMQYGTAYGALIEFSNVGKGDSVLITAGVRQ